MSSPSLGPPADTMRDPRRDPFTGAQIRIGVMGSAREMESAVRGRSGTLGEFAIAYEQGKLICVLAGTGGITTAFPALEACFNERTGSEILYDPDPDVLVDRLLTRCASSAYSCPCYPAAVRPKADAGDPASDL